MFGSRNFIFKGLVQAQKMAFSIETRELNRRIARISAKVKEKQTVVDMKKLQGYLEQTKVDKSLNQAITRTARYDQEFNDFLKQYKDQNKDIANILDVSHYSLDQDLTKSQKMREEEILMLEEFRKRKQEKTLYINSDEEDADIAGKRRKKKEEFDEEEEKIVDNDRFSPKDSSALRKATHSNLVGKRLQWLSENETFLILILDRGVTTLVTTLNRVNHFRYLVYLGNCNGVIGYGTGKGGNFQIALKKAIRNAKKNLIAIPMDHFRSLTTSIDVKINGMRVYLEPKDDFDAWGSPTLGAMLLLAGVNHCKFKLVARNPNNYNLCLCVFKALTRAVTPKEMAEQLGFKVFHQSYMPYKYYNQRRRNLV